MTILCKDCRYHRLGWFERLFKPWMGKLAKCARPELIKKKERDNRYDLVDGTTVSDEVYHCAVNRKFECGEHAKYFEPWP